MKKFKSIGIVGGAGPIASVLLHRQIIEQCQQQGAVEDDDFPEIVLYNYPFSSMVHTKDSESNKNKIAKELQYCIDKLKALDIELVSIACNTLHNYIDDVDFHDLTFYNLIHMTQQESEKHDFKKMLFLGTPTSREHSLYTDSSETIVFPNDEYQEKVTAIIYNILSGRILNDDAKQLVSIINDIQDDCDSIILGCTELSVLYDQNKKVFENVTVSVVDPVSILSSHLLKEARI